MVHDWDFIFTTLFYSPHPYGLTFFINQSKIVHLTKVRKNIHLLKMGVPIFQKIFPEFHRRYWPPFSCHSDRGGGGGYVTGCQGGGYAPPIRRGVLSTFNPHPYVDNLWSIIYPPLINMSVWITRRWGISLCEPLVVSLYCGKSDRGPRAGDYSFTEAESEVACLIFFYIRVGVKFPHP